MAEKIFVLLLFLFGYFLVKELFANARSARASREYRFGSNIIRFGKTERPAQKNLVLGDYVSPVLTVANLLVHKPRSPDQ